MYYNNFVRKRKEMIGTGFDASSAKYVAASFFATYCSGLTHPLDVVKTRLQSKNHSIEAMTVERPVKTWCLDIALFARPFNPSIKAKGFKASSKDFTSLCCVNHWPFPFSFGCTYLFIKV